LLTALTLVAPSYAQISSSAFRVLGQPDLRRNSFNSVDGSEFRAPSGVALDTRSGMLRLYIADFGNHRVLGWADAQSFQNGQPADVVLGQRNLQQSSPFGIGNPGFNGPSALTVDPNSGNVYVADTANHRVLRFEDPFANRDRVEPSRVYGQPNFNSNTANNGGLSARTLRGPVGVRFDAAGNLWICDTGNHRLVRYSRAALDSDNAEADLVLGQDAFTEGGTNSTSNQVTAKGFNTPLSLAFHADGSMYVADTQNARVLVFQAPFQTGEDAVRVIGQPDFTSRTVPPTITPSAMRGPNSVFLTASGNLLVAVQAENRVLVFEGIAAAGPQPAANRALGQPLLTSDFSNVNTAPLASANGLSGPGDVIADPNGNIYVADSANHRVLVYTPGASQASRVLGQVDFTRNTQNRVSRGSMGAARDVVVDYSDPDFPVYVSDPDNSRILFWRASVLFRSGDPADGVIGQ
jgi:sugar lactone lactonase YvrE